MRFPGRMGALWFAVVLVTPLLGTWSAASPAADQTAIQHVLVLMQENRSFDSYLGRLHFQGQRKATPLRLSRHNPNPAKKGAKPIRVFHKKHYCEVADLDHSWTGSHVEYDHGKMDGFTKANVNAKDPTGRRAMGFYTKKDLPFYYWLYKTFAIGDRYFQSVLSQTFPNRFYLLAGTSFGRIRNDFPTAPDQFSQKTVFNELDDAGVSWRIYYNQVPFAFLFAYVRNNAAGHVFPISQYYVDAQAGTLPQVSFIDPIFVGQASVENDEHPPSNVQVGESFVHDVVQALTQSPNWPTSAMFITYDEHGGFSDHVPPPRAPRPDNIKPMLQKGDTKAAFDRYGFRVPAVVVSPFSKRHFVSHVVHDHTSILRSIEDRFGLPTLTRRDAAAKPMWEFFDFSHPSFLKPPALPAAPVNQQEQQYCKDKANGAP
jgi:phospholipase C